MIVEIHSSASTMSRSLRYNEDKVRCGVASVLCTANIDGDSLVDINSAFVRRERSSVRDVEHVAFHMSVNPGPDDRISEKDIPAFVQEIMSGMGYGWQPWVVFRHEDITRVHYHVVSIRIDERGRKIRDWFEKKNCERIVSSLEHKYGYAKGNGGMESQEKKACIPVFGPGKGDILQTIELCVKDSLSYRFTTERQFAEILKLHGVSIREGIDRKDVRGRLSFQGLDSDGRPCTGSISDVRFHIDVRESITARIGECRSMDFKEERMMLRGSLIRAVDNGDTFLDALESLRAQHIDTVIYKDSSGVPRGMTLVDHRTRCAFRASEVSRSLGATLLSMAVDEHNLHVAPGSKESSGGYIENEKPQTGLSDTLKSCLAAMLMDLPGGEERMRPDDKRKKKKKRQ